MKALKRLIKINFKAILKTNLLYGKDYVCFIHHISCYLQIHIETSVVEVLVNK